MRTNCIRVLVALSLAISFAAEHSAADEVTVAKTLVSRLSEYKHVGLRPNRETPSYDLHIFTPEQQLENVASRSRFEAMRTKMAAAKSSEERDALREELESVMRAGTPVMSHYTMVFVGDDYIELTSTTDKAESLLIPMQSIRRVHLPVKPETKEKK